MPYIESPSEAEAQCATLENLSLTHGTITEDNDVFLFGGHKVYRNVFSPNDDIEMFLHTDISSLLGLNRDKLIVLAYFLGSDYTNGLEGDDNKIHAPFVWEVEETIKGHEQNNIPVFS